MAAQFERYLALSGGVGGAKLALGLLGFKGKLRCLNVGLNILNAAL